MAKGELGCASLFANINKIMLITEYFRRSGARSPQPRQLALQRHVLPQVGQRAGEVALLLQQLRQLPVRLAGCARAWMRWARARAWRVLRMADWVSPRASAISVQVRLAAASNHG